MESEALKRRIRRWLLVFVAGLALSGITAVPLEAEVGRLRQLVSRSPLWVGAFAPGLTSWLDLVALGLRDTYARYPFMAYGTDWLAFAHLVIAVAFWGPLRDPVRNRWVVEFGMIACALVVPMALVCGALRGIPVFWRLIDCSFGVLGFVPLWICRRMIRRLEAPLLA